MRTAIVDEARALSSDDLLTTGEAAKLLGTSRQHVVDLCNEGLLPFTYGGKKHRRVRRGDVEDLRRSSSDKLSRDQQRSLWLAYATAAHIVADPDRARRVGLRNVEKMRPTARGQARLWLEEWHELLDGPITELLEAYTSPNLRGRELRQNSPFASLLSATERAAVLNAWKNVPASEGEPLNREQLAHVIRAAASIAVDGDMVIIGSQSVLGSFDVEELPGEATLSVEADVAFWDDPDEEKADRVDGSIGEESPFHSTFGYYGQGVTLDTARLPTGWKDRLVPFDWSDTGGGNARCLEVHDLIVAKLVAGREKDMTFAEALLAHGLVDRETLETRIGDLEQPIDRERTGARLTSVAARADDAIAARKAANAAETGDA